ncbi:hypothetical protein SAMN02745121_04982 [Nannocystis exedens]|uniref:Uncharacterized protein n=1 Tax=Nannocystis exedens TaxID=54 RepID=A0A1I2C9A8_9BACT|nr:hypothetical protein [Nannocystis exedens]PCC68449.1 hypothetical protein NAEX_01464 [Nannocystis exedens]SFE64929.1 hypothetical protein SAMN02745121_04982 [Nannocystis exedens]
MPLAPAAAVVLLLTAPRREETGHFLASPWPGDPTTALGTREALQVAVRAAPSPAGPELVALTGDDPGGHLARAQAHLQRAEWRMAVFYLNRHAEVADARSAVIARYDAGLIDIGLGGAARHLFEALLEAPTSTHSLAAELFWGARSLLVDDSERRWHARMALTGFGRAAGPELQILAEIELARLLWQQSCPIADIGGTCGVMSRVNWHVGCGRVQRDALLVVERDAELAGEARRRLQSALRRARALPTSERLSEAVMHARWLLAESTFEELLRLHQPIGLDFSLEEWRAELPGRRHALILSNQRATHDASTRRMSAFITRKYALHRQLEREYDAIIAEADPHTIFAALHRGAQATRDVVLHLELDRNRPPKDDFFCCYSDRFAPMLAAAAERTASCASLAVETGLVDEWATRCQDAAAELEPDRFPSRDELTPDRASSQPVAFDLVANLDHD